MEPTEPTKAIDTAGLPQRLESSAMPTAAPTRLLPRKWSFRGPWRVAVDEQSMVPALEPGDWLLVDPTVRRWPRRGSIVVFREPASDMLVVKRVAARAPAEVDTEFGRLALEPGEAWLLGDASASHDSRHYGPVGVDRLVARAWFRYGPPGRIGPLSARSRRTR